MISKIVLCFCLVSFISWGHIDIFDKSKGTISENTSFNGSFVFDISVSEKQTFSLSDICISKFNVGEDSTASIRLVLKNKKNNKILFQTDTIINNKFNEDVFIQMGCLLFKNSNYQLILSSIGKDTDNSCCFYTPKSLPVTPANIFLILNNGYAYSTNEFKYNIINSYPSISFGADIQNGINIIMNQKGSISLDTINCVRNVVFSFSDNVKDYTIEKVGLSFFDVGKNNIGNVSFTLFDESNKSILLIRDTIFNNIHKKPVEIDFSFPFEINKKYILQTKIGNSNDNDNSYLILHATHLPYVDNLSFTKIHHLFKNELNNLTEDSLCLGITFSLKEKEEALKTESLIYSNNYKWKIFNFENELKLTNEATQDETTWISITNLEGVQLLYNQIENNEFSFSKSFLPAGYYFITIISEKEKKCFQFVN